MLNKKKNLTRNTLILNFHELLISPIFQLPFHFHLLLQEDNWDFSKSSFQSLARNYTHVVNGHYLTTKCSSIQIQIQILITNPKTATLCQSFCIDLPAIFADIIQTHKKLGDYFFRLFLIRKVKSLYQQHIRS